MIKTVSGAGPFQCMTFMRRDVVCRGALDFILRVVLARAVGMSFVIEILDVYRDDCAADVSSFRVPSYMIADLESLSHHEPPVAVSTGSPVEAEPRTVWTVSYTHL